jgi:hypothetical protein
VKDGDTCKSIRLAHQLSFGKVVSYNPVVCVARRSDEGRLAGITHAHVSGRVAAAQGLNGEQARPGSSRWLTEARHSTANAGQRHFQPDIAERGATGSEGVDPKGQSGDLERLLLPTKKCMLIREQIRIMCSSAVRGFSLEV